MIKLLNLCKIFKSKMGKIAAVDSLNFKVKKGEIFGLLGPNGAGKTTTIKMLSTLITPTSGTAVINGYDIRKEAREVRASINISVGDERSFYFRLSGYQNLEFFGALQGLSGKLLRSRIEYALNELNILKFRNMKFMRYSSGVKKKLNLARALLTDVPCYFFDEPTSSIDPKSAVDIRNLIRKLRRKGKTIILATHNMYEAEELCDRIAILNKGKVLVIADPDLIKKKARGFVIRAKLDKEIIPQFKSSIAELSFVDEIVDDTNGWISIVTSEKSRTIKFIYSNSIKQNFSVYDLIIKEPCLEDVFLELTEKK